MNPSKEFYFNEFYFDAIGYDNLEVVRACINSGIDINCVDDQGWTGLMNACWADKYELVKMFIACGASIDFATEDILLTALQVSCIRCSNSCAKLLISSGADITLKDAEGYTAMDLARENDNTEMYNYLKLYQRVM